MNIFKAFGPIKTQMKRVDWDNYHPLIEFETENFVTTECPPTREGRDALLHMERMRALGYRFVVEGWGRLLWEKIPMNAESPKPEE